ncbi:MAG: tRNA lysidine(34) synthetase TilS [Acidobacteria bacterium]|nr:tRNA lysidine(34) synthetase TilS [Acidobacteriota bacterium]
MDPLAERVLVFVRRQALIPPGGRVLAAVSGGGDSVALLYLLAELAERNALTLAGVAHLNHRLRSRESDEDERLCRDLASRFDVPCVVESADVAELSRSERISVEHAGHRARYAFFDRAADRLDACRVALGHTIDDQAETFLLRPLRGAGTEGLSAIRPRAGKVVRPLLRVTRAELRAYLAAREVSFREDASNLDRRVPRNRIRHDLIPHLQGYSPRVVEVLAREAEIARAEAEWLAHAANEMSSGLVKSTKTGVEVDAAGLAALHPALGRRVARNVLGLVSGRSVGFDHIERLRRLATAVTGRVDFPGCRADRLESIIRLTARAGRGTVDRAESFAYRLDVPGEVSVPEAGVTISAEPAEMGLSVPFAWPKTGGNPAFERTVAVAAAGPLAVRNWRPGDRFRPLGLRGHRKKLQDLFVDRKVSRVDRSRIPLVLDDRNRIVWVVGQAVSDEFRVTGAAASVLILRVRTLGDNS